MGKNIKKKKKIKISYAEYVRRLLAQKKKERIKERNNLFLCEMLEEYLTEKGSIDDFKCYINAKGFTLHEIGFWDNEEENPKDEIDEIESDEYQAYLKSEYNNYLNNQSNDLDFWDSLKK